MLECPHVKPALLRNSTNKGMLECPQVKPALQRSINVHMSEMLSLNMQDTTSLMFIVRDTLSFLQ